VAFVTLNGDVLFRSSSGIRALRRGYRDLSQGWSSRIINFEMVRVQAETQVAFLKPVSAAFHNYRAFFTELPTNEVTWPPAGTDGYLSGPGFERGTSFAWLSSLLTTPISTLTEDRAPAWEGIWCGLRILQLLPVITDGVPRLFALALTKFNSIALYELSYQHRKDLSSPRTPGDYTTCEEVPVQWGFETRALFTKERLQRKKLHDLEIGLVNLRESVTVRVLYRPIGEGNWTEWFTKTIELEGCPSGKTELGCITGGNVAAQARYPLRFGSPDDTVCNDGQRRPAPEFYSLQLRIAVTGSCQISYLLVRAIVLPRLEAYEECETLPISPPELVCSANEPERTYQIG
jgi:hypothetical protein